MMTSHNKFALSGLAYERAKKVMPGGNTRSSVYESPFPLYLRSGKGAYVTDVDENCYLDFQNNFTALIHGYGHGGVAPMHEIDEIRGDFHVNNGTRLDSFLFPSLDPLVALTERASVGSVV